jgi:hypothetical protein
LAPFQKTATQGESTGISPGTSVAHVLRTFSTEVSMKLEICFAVLTVFSAVSVQASCPGQSARESYSQYESRLADCRRSGLEIAPQSSNEPYSEYQNRIQLSIASHIGFAPQGNQESYSDYQSRIQASKRVGIALAPQGDQESYSEYQNRLQESIRSGVAIQPQGDGESYSDYRSRVQESRTSGIAIYPQGANESWAEYQGRLTQARNALPVAARAPHSSRRGADQGTPGESSPPNSGSTSTGVYIPSENGTVTVEPDGVVVVTPDE